MATDFDAAVIGAGPAGMTAAIALAHQGLDTALVARSPASPDPRTSALLTGSVVSLETIGVWARCAAQAEPLKAIRIVDDTGRLLRAPEILFEAREIGLPEFGYSIENARLALALGETAAALPRLRVISEDADAIVPREASVQVRTSSHTFACALAVGADGRNSPCRAAARIDVRRWSHPQAALTFTVTHGRPHDGVSTEFHTPAGPLTFVPLPGKRSSVVLVTAPDEAQALARLSDRDLSDEIERRSHSAWGKIVVEGMRGVFALGGLAAHTMGARRVALVGEAAHVLPPIGAQGLNLGLHDAMAIGRVAGDAKRAGLDPGAPQVTSTYNDQRRGDVTLRASAVDILNRSLLTSLLPAQGLRSLALHLLDRTPPLRRAIMRQGIL